MTSKIRNVRPKLKVRKFNIDSTHLPIFVMRDSDGYLHMTQSFSEEVPRTYDDFFRFANYEGNGQFTTKKSNQIAVQTKHLARFLKFLKKEFG